MLQAAYLYYKHRGTSDMTAHCMLAATKSFDFSGIGHNTVAFR